MGDASVSNGLFTVQLDFGAAAFQGDARWLDLTGTSGGGYTSLSYWEGGRR